MTSSPKFLQSEQWALVSWHEQARLSLSAAPLVRSEKASVPLSFALLSPSPKDDADYMTRDSVVLVAWMSEVSELGQEPVHRTPVCAP